MCSVLRRILDITRSISLKDAVRLTAGVDKESPTIDRVARIEDGKFLEEKS